MKLHKWEDVRAEMAREVPGFEEQVARKRERLEFALGLQGLRKGRGKRQVEMAEALGMTQANISRIEREDDVRLSTLEKYVDALGGRLEIHVVFDDGVEYVVGPNDDEDDA